MIVLQNASLPLSTDWGNLSSNSGMGGGGGGGGVMGSKGYFVGDIISVGLIFMVGPTLIPG